MTHLPRVGLGGSMLSQDRVSIRFQRFTSQLKDMDLDVSHFFNLEQLIDGGFTDTKGSTNYHLFKVEKEAQIEVHILNE